MKKNHLAIIASSIIALVIAIGASAATGAPAKLLSAAEKKTATILAYKKYYAALKDAKSVYQATVKTAQQQLNTANKAAVTELKKDLENIKQGKVLQEGEVTLTGTYVTTTSSGIPDTGATLHLQTVDYGEVNVGLPGFIRCQTNEIYYPTQPGEKVEVRGNYQNGEIQICGSSNYYIKKADIQGVACTLEARAGLILYVKDVHNVPITGATITTDPTSSPFIELFDQGYSGLWEASGTFKYTVSKSGFVPATGEVTLTRGVCHVIAQAKTITLQAANPTIEEYVKANISALSPQKEQLGGKFYVTHVEAHGGAGTVQYEDGHNTYTADFTYTVDQSGKPSVTSFHIR